MKQKVSIKNIITAVSIITAVVSIVLLDHWWVQNDFLNLKAKLNMVRIITISKNKPLVVRFNRKEVSILEFPKGPLLETFRFSTISKVEYNTTIGNNMIVFQGGMTSLFNKRVHGGEIALRSWFGFEKYIHVNCAGLVQEGRYPES